MIMKKKTFRLIIKILRYLLPAVIGWFEGDTHAIADSVVSILSLF